MSGGPEHVGPIAARLVAKLCNHRICRCAASDRALRAAVLAASKQDWARSDSLALHARDLHLEEVECKLNTDGPENLAAYPPAEAFGP